MLSPRVFTLEEVNALVPELRKLVGVQLERATEIQGLAAKLHRQLDPRARQATTGVVDITPQAGDDAEVRSLKRELAGRIQRYREGWNKVTELGATVKDPTIGLLDFYGRVDDRLVCLCWKYPEESIDYYHEIDAGFAGRKSLEDARKRMLN